MRGAGMQIGAHTVSHPILARLDEAEARREIVRSKDDLESITGRPVSLFAYPNGRPGRDYTARDVELARGAGFGCAVSTSPGAVRAARYPDLSFQLPRFTPWDRTAGAFGARLVRNLFTEPSAA